jgi:hypothetical protein
MSSTGSVAMSPGPSWRQYIPHVLLGLGGVIMVVNIVLLSFNIGTQDTNQDLRKYVGISLVPNIISLILIGIGIKMILSQFPAYGPLVTIVMSVVAIGISYVALCTSLIEKAYA